MKNPIHDPTDPRTWNRFPGEQRVHIGLNVSDLTAALRFYQVLLGTGPSKIRPGYAKFEPRDPSLNLSLSERPSSASRPPAHGVHYGVQVKTVEAVEAAVERLRAGGLKVTVEESTTCCYAGQTKAWVTDPDGNSWEVFVVTDADTAIRKDAGSSCCQNDVPDAVACC